HPGSEEHALRIARWLADDDHLIQPLGQEAHAAVDLAQAALAVDVLGVLRAIALRRGIGDFLRHAWTFDSPQLIELRTKLLRSFRRDVRRSFGRRRSV